MGTQSLPIRHRSGEAWLSQEAQQCAVYLAGMGPTHVVWSAVDLDVLEIADQFGQAAAGRFDWKDPIPGTLNGERRHIDFREITAEIGQPGRDAGQHGECGSTGG